MLFIMNMLSSWLHTSYYKHTISSTVQVQYCNCKLYAHTRTSSTVRVHVDSRLYKVKILLRFVKTRVSGLVSVASRTRRLVLIADVEWERPTESHALLVDEAHVGALSCIHFCDHQPLSWASCLHVSLVLLDTGAANQFNCGQCCSVCIFIVFSIKF